MANVYSEVFYSAVTSAGFHTLYTVPTGFRIVVRDITFFKGGAWYEAANGLFIFSDPGTTVLAGVRTPWARCGKFYHWVGHQVLDEGSLYAEDDDGGDWQLRISGYKLTLP